MKTTHFRMIHFNDDFTILHQCINMKCGFFFASEVSHLIAVNIGLMVEINAAFQNELHLPVYRFYNTSLYAFVQAITQLQTDVFCCCNENS